MKWGKSFQKMGIQCDIPSLAKEVECRENREIEPVPINKVGEYCEGEEGNTLLPVQ